MVVWIESYSTLRDDLRALSEREIATQWVFGSFVRDAAFCYRPGYAALVLTDKKFVSSRRLHYPPAQV